MKQIRQYITILVLFLVFCIADASATAAEAKPAEAQCPVVAAPVVRLCIFQNGLAYITRRLTVPGPGLYELDKPPYPMRGTLNIDSATQIDLTSSLREAPLTGTAAANALRRRDYNTQPIDQLVNSLRDKEIILTRKAPDNAHAFLSGVLQGARGGMLQLKTSKGVLLLPMSEILSIETAALNPDAPGTTRVPYMRLNVRGISDQKRVDIRLSYLGEGLLWTPSYQVELLDGTHLRMQGQATLRNELEDLTSVECELLTGAPALSFAKSPDLTQPGLTIDGFLTSGQAPNSYMKLTEENTEPGYAWEFYSEARGIRDAPQTPRLSFENAEATATDIAYKKIGAVTLKKNESLAIPLEFSNADYEAAAEWLPDEPALSLVADIAQPVEEHGKAVWSVLRFRNPYSFPLPAGPAAIRQKDRLLGQAALSYTPAGEYCSLRLSRALNVTAFATEHELFENKQTISNEEKNGTITRSSTRVQREYEGELVLRNLRAEPVKLFIRKTVNGVVLDAEQKPEKIRTTSPAGSVNECWQLRWEIILQPQQEQKIRYTYRQFSN